MSAYSDHAHAWNAAGWGALPLPAGQKFPPPKHWTGIGAAYPSGADVQAWIEEFPEANLGLRMPENVVGIDVDQYGDKHGLQTLIAATKQWGKLPPSVRITSRPDTRAGIYLYRLPAGASSAHFMGELPGGNVEIIRAGHRYAVGPGSLHPEGRVYEIIGVGEPEMRYEPIVIDYLPELPASWVEGLTNRPAEKAAAAEHIQLAEGRGDRYAQRAVEFVVQELADIADWPVGKTDDRGRGWEKIQADAAFRLASLALADWNTLTVEQAGRAFGTAAPVGSGWTVADVAKKWRSQLARAEPADPPKDVDDPLAPGYQAPAGAPAIDPLAPSPFDAAAEQPAPPAADVSTAGPTPQIAAEWGKHTWDDIGNGERIVRMFGPRLRYVPELKSWLTYQPELGRWDENPDGGELAAMRMLDALPKVEVQLYSDREYMKGQKKTSERLEFIEWWRGQRSASRVGGAARMARVSGALKASAFEFDARPMLLNVANGVIDLETGQLQPHEPDLKLRRQVNITIDPAARAPRWEAWLEQMMPDVEMREYLQRVFGYSLTGRTGEQVMFVHHGPPATGKSVFLQVLSALLGEFARVVPPTTLLTKRQEQHPTDVMGLEGRRVLQLDEVPEGARFDEALVKRLTGESGITARGMGENFRDFRIVGKVHVVTNHLPHISDDPATQRRIHLVQWKVQIPEEERVQGLADWLVANELQGIMNWALQGCLQWDAQKLSRPAAAHLAALDYFEEEDEFGDFMAEKLSVTEVAWTPSATIYRWYLSWCNLSNVKPMSKVAFGRKLSGRKVGAIKSGGVRGFHVVLKGDPIEMTRDPLAM